jgi:hypothetical protein
LVCLGRDLWKELVAVVEGETWAATPTAAEPAGEGGPRHFQILALHLPPHLTLPVCGVTLLP